MFASLLHEARMWPVLWRHRLTYYRLGGRREHWLFGLMLVLPVTVIGAIVCFAYFNGTAIQPNRVQALQREAARERRHANELQCLAENVYYEARGEPLDGQYAVAEATLNRTRALHFPHTICEVVHEARWDPARRRMIADFSWTELGEQYPADGIAWKQALKVANAAYEEVRAPVVPEALFYHATAAHPAWARTRKAIATIGNHVFYK
jgi:N-acetylmuramoyl-L-alanine amidase